MENYNVDQVEIGILQGGLMDTVRTRSDAFARPMEFIGAEIEIAGSEVTNREAAEIFGRVLGKKVKFQRLPLPIVRLVLGKEFHQMFRWFNHAGFKADIDGLRRRYAEVHLRSLEEWLQDEGWHERVLHVRAPRE
jgi:uncharacterized protein YbjT (DUF2867 family)